MWTAWGFAWPMLLVVPVVMGLGFIMLTRVMRAGGGPMAGCGWGPRDGDRGHLGSGTAALGPVADPLTIIRERYARGEIDHEELERRLADLLDSEPTRTPPL